jgi:hypothetical protein
MKQYPIGEKRGCEEIQKFVPIRVEMLKKQ